MYFSFIYIDFKSLKIIGRGGVGMDNIDVEYARSVQLKKHKL